MMVIDQSTDFEQFDIATLALIAAEEAGLESEVATCLLQLTRMAEWIAAEMNETQGEAAYRELLSLFFGPLGFNGDWQGYYAFRNCLLSEVLDRRCGIPVTLGIVLMHLGKRLGLPFTGICFPGHFMLAFPVAAGEWRYVDPFTGEGRDRAWLAAKLKGAKGGLAKLTEEDLEAADNRAIFTHLLNVLKAALIREERLAEALHCSELLLRMEPDNPYEIRERGFLLHQLDCVAAACADYRYFMEQCPDDPVTKVLQMQISAMEQDRPLLH